MVVTIALIQTPTMKLPFAPAVSSVATVPGPSRFALAVANETAAEFGVRPKIGVVLAGLAAS